MAIEISDAIWNTAKEVLESKKAALAAGDEAVSGQVGEGKDIISVLCTSIPPYPLKDGKGAWC